MRHIYNGDENEITDLTGGVTGGGLATSPPEKASEQSSTNQPPRCVFSYLTQNMLVGELTNYRKVLSQFSSALVAQPFL